MSDTNLNEKVNYLKYPLSDGTLVADYCNDWAAMGQLIIEYKIGISPPYSLGEWRAFTKTNTSMIDKWHKSPLRAAAIVCILVKQEEL